MRYEKAKAEVVLFDNSDVVTTSPGDGCYGDRSFTGNYECDGNAQKIVNKCEDFGNAV